MRRLALALLLPLAACSQPAAPPEIAAIWARDTVGGTTNAAIYMTITSPSADRLLSASAANAAKTDLMTMAGGTSGTEMTYVKQVDLPAGQPVSLNPTGLHVWLEGLKQPLKTGESFPLTLKFEKAGERQVTVSVIAPAAMPPMAGMKM